MSSFIRVSVSAIFLTLLLHSLAFSNAEQERTMPPEQTSSEGQCRYKYREVPRASTAWIKIIVSVIISAVVVSSLVIAAIGWHQYRQQAKAAAKKIGASPATEIPIQIASEGEVVKIKCDSLQVQEIPEGGKKGETGAKAQSVRKRCRKSKA